MKETPTLDRFFSAWQGAPEDQRLAALAAGLAVLRGDCHVDDPGAALTITRSARRAGLSRTSIYEAIKRGDLHPVRLHAGGNQRILESELRRFLFGRKA